MSSRREPLGAASGGRAVAAGNGGGVLQRRWQRVGRLFERSSTLVLEFATGRGWSWDGRSGPDQDCQLGLAGLATRSACQIERIWQPDRPVTFTGIRCADLAPPNWRPDHPVNFSGFVNFSGATSRLRISRPDQNWQPTERIWFWLVGRWWRGEQGWERVGKAGDAQIVHMRVDSYSKTTLRESWSARYWFDIPFQLRFLRCSALQVTMVSREG